jgi:putative DNA primase/helicase
MTHVIEANGHVDGAQDRVLDALGNEFTPESLRLLDEGAIPLADALRYGVKAVRHPDHVPPEIHRKWVKSPGMLFEWRDLDRTVIQFRPDVPAKDADGELHKYVQPGGSGTFLGHLRRAGEGEPVLFVEGTKQGLAAAVWAPEGWGVVAVPGCRNWSGTDLSWAEDRRIVCLFDADVTTNRDVWEAATGLKEALDAEGAGSVVFARLAGARAKEGLDDVLGRRDAAKRTPYLRRIAEQAKKSVGRAPARKKSGNAAVLFNEKGSLLAQTAASAVLEGQPAALAHGSMVALYRDGRYIIDRGREQLFAVVQSKLGEEYRPNWRTTIEEVLIGRLAESGTRLPERMDAPVLNCRNGMLDLRTGELLPHDPAFLSVTQIPVAWDADAVCPGYLDWAASVIPDQLEDLEESASLMLDPSATPGKAVFLFGPSHSGKSTYLRLMGRVAGAENTSAVTLHQLSDDRFAAANLYQRMLNVAADLSAKHVADMSVFKMLTGEDMIHANRKYGKEFTFTNQALFAFSANELPTVSEASRAYANRVKPFEFPYSFTGREDPGIEDRMVREELPGILVRWVAAWQRYAGRGGYLPTDSRVMREFETRSDRVALWVSEKCTVHPDAAGRLVGPDRGTKKSTLHELFKAWAKDEDSSGSMSARKFIERLRSVSGVGEVRLRHENKNVGLNVTPGCEPTPVELTPNKLSNTDSHTDKADTETDTGTDSDTIKVKEGVGGVPSVGNGLYKPYVRDSKVNDLEESGVDSARHMGSLGDPHTFHTAHTLPTPEAAPGPVSPRVTDDPGGFDFYRD